MPRELHFTRHASDLGRWESAVGPPHPALRSYVNEYVGGVEETKLPLCRRELPADIAPLIINFGAPFRIFDPTNTNRWTDISSFVAGAFDSYVLVGSTGAYGCVQVNFTILGLRLFVGRPMHDLATRTVALEDVFGNAASRLTSELYEAASWEARFDILDREILARIDRTRHVPEWVQWVRQRLVRTGGQTNIHTLVDKVGYSQKHVIAQFTTEFGLSPKTFARVLRFGRAADMLKVSERGRLADIAHSCGYYDQAHFTRDFRAFAGVSPTELLASQLPNRGGFVV